MKFESSLIVMIHVPHQIVLYFRAQPPTYLCSVKTEATIPTKWSNSFIRSRKV